MSRTSKGVEELRAKPCRNGHSREDAFLYWRVSAAGTTYPDLQCRTCVNARVREQRATGKGYRHK